MREMAATRGGSPRQTQGKHDVRGPARNKFDREKKEQSKTIQSRNHQKKKQHTAVEGSCASTRSKKGKEDGRKRGEQQSKDDAVMSKKAITIVKVWHVEVTRAQKL
jgi:hypothetical protein